MDLNIGLSTLGGPDHGEELKPQDDYDYYYIL
jgi:hypothetical protein